LENPASKSKECPKRIPFCEAGRETFHGLLSSIDGSGHTVEYSGMERMKKLRFSGSEKEVILELIPAKKLCKKPEKFSDISQCLKNRGYQLCLETDGPQAMAQNGPIPAHVIYMTESADGCFIQDYNAEKGTASLRFALSSHALPESYLVAVRRTASKRK
jgi:hypothetical protein